MLSGVNQQYTCATTAEVICMSSLVGGKFGFSSMSDYIKNSCGDPVVAESNDSDYYSFNHIMSRFRE